MENQEFQTPTLAVINGGVERTVTFLDGREELVKVRQLPLRQMATYGSAQGDEEALCALFADQDAAWVDSLTTESQEEIVTVGDELNTGFFSGGRSGG